MATLKDTLIQGSARVTDTLYSNNINISDIITAKGLIISSTAAEEHIKFSRTSINYILFPDNTNAGIAIGYATGTAYCPLIIQKSNVFPGGTTETINFGLSSNRWNTIYGKSGNFTGTVIISKSQDASGTANNSPALIVGGTATTAHLELDGNEIMAKADGTTVGPLYLNNDGGVVQIGKGGLIAGNATAGAEVDVKAVSNAGEIYFWSANSTTGNRGIWLKNAGGATSSALFTVNQSNRISAMATIACTPEINYTKAAGDASALLKLTNTSTSGSPFIGVDFLVPSFVSGEIKHIFGKSHSTNNSAYISYSHSADSSGNNAITFGLYNTGLARLSVNSGLTINGQITSQPISEDYEGGKLNLSPNSAVVGGECGIALQEKDSKLEIFGIPDDLLHTDTGTSLVIDPYAKTITGGYTITGTLSGNASSATKVKITSVAFPTSGSKTYYLTFTTSTTTGNQNLNNGARLYLFENTGNSALNIGSSSTSGAITLHNANGKYADIVSSAFTENRTLTLPDATGTIALTSSNITGNAATASRLVSRGNVTAETDTNKPAVTGLSMSQVYSNGYPCTYGNVMTMYGAGAGQLLLGWSGSSSSTTGVRSSAFIRSQRDSANMKWSDWYEILDTGNYSSYALPLGGGTMAGTITLANTGLKTPNTAGFTTDQYGNFKHQSETASHTWQLLNNAGTGKFIYTWETGDLSISGGLTATNGFTGNLTGNASSASKIKTYNVTTNDNSNATGYFLVYTWTINAWSNHRMSFIVRSRHGGNGLVDIAVGNNSSTISIDNMYAQIMYWGNTGAGSIITSDYWLIYGSSDGTKAYLFAKYSDYNESTITPLTDTQPEKSTWITSINASTYGVQKATTQINVAVSAGSATNVTGTVTYQHGGTGLTTLGSAGQVLKVNSSANGIEWGTVSTADEKVKVAANITTAADYPVVFANSNKSTTAAETAGLNKSGTKFYFNPSTGLLTATQVANAIWNDYAEYRKQLYTIQPGYVIKDTDSGYIVKANERLIPGAQIVSDTWGHSMGKTDECQTPVAVAGRVLAYTYRPREQYHAGMAVCSAPGGTIDIMTREEIRDYPDAIIGIVSEIPDYEEWGSGKVKVDGRIWIKVR